jgi:beta-glucanase (GH16 family)
VTKPFIFLMAAINIVIIGLAFIAFLPDAPAQTTRSESAKTLLDMSQVVQKRLVPTSDQVTAVRNQDPVARGLTVTIQPGKDDYPGLNIKPEGAAWNLSAFGHVEARVVNTGTKPLSVALRVDNAENGQDNPWNTESISLEPGKSGTVTTIFGYTYGHKPGYALKSTAIVNLLLFTGKSDTVQSFRIESLAAGGQTGETPAVVPEDVRLKPPHGALFSARVKVVSQDGHASFTGTSDHQSLQVVFTPSPGVHSVSVTPDIGRWDLRDYLAVVVAVRNMGQTPIAPRVRLESNGGVSDWVSSAAPLRPGAASEITVPFGGVSPADLTRKETGSHVTSDAVSAVTLASEGAQGEQRLRVESIQAALPPQKQMPIWLGQRPPVAGDWVKTLDDEFNGTALDQSVWSIYGNNDWDQQTHWSKADVLLGGGVIRLRYEKKTGFRNDNPAQKSSAYAAGYLHTYDKWAQRYGYFEARMKLPTAPGLWPAFWMMPDRGVAAGPEQWRRQDTGNGGMEFDIMEHLTRWGPHRYNIAMHYDGYGKDHKQTGSDKIYVQPDKDGFLTCGLLWTPGSAVYYCNGREVMRWEDPRISHVPAMLMFTLPQGGWDNSIVKDARLPDDFVIDYVRVWQRKDLASASDGKKTSAK